MSAAVLAFVLSFSQEIELPMGGDSDTEQEFPPFEGVVEGLETIEGYYTLYKSDTRLLAAIPADQMETPFLLATSFARGFLSGWMADDRLVQWQRVDKKLVLIEPDVRHRAKEGDPLASSVERNYTETLIADLDILTESPSGAVVVDLLELLVHQAARFVGWLGLGLGGDPYFSGGGSLAKVHQVKGFPSNVEIEIDLPGGGGDFRGFGGGAIMTIHYSLSELKETGYQPRLADDRVGYFISAVKDYSRSAREETRFVRMVNRWHLEKADPELDVSPPKEPIVFYIEKTVPVKYRRAVREGILEWNRAFEQVGISEAIVVRQQTDTNEFANLDPEDVRYNFFRWTTSDWAFAMGPSRVDPRTGQILDADIIFDDAMIRFYLQDHKVLVGETALSMLPPSLREFLMARPGRNPLRFELPGDPEAREKAIAELERRASLGLTSGDGRRVCSAGRGLLHQLAMAHMAGLLVQGEDYEQWPEEFVHQVVKETAMHEVGHTLGLRHNFKASTWRPINELNAEGAPQDTSGSVMDYNPINLAAEGSPQGNFMPGTIGPYDYWAIAYGYTPIQGTGGESEKPELDKIAQRGAESGLAYGTDEDLGSSDPSVNTWDIGQDPLAYAVHRMALVQSLQEKLMDRVVREGDSYAGARSAFFALLIERWMAGYVAARYIGGHYSYRDHRGDPGERVPVQPVAAEKQREALAFLRDHVFSDSAWRFSPDFLNRLAASRWWHWGAEPDSQTEIPIHDIVLALQSWALFDLMNPETLGRIYDAEMRVPADQDAMTLPELFLLLSDSIFSELVAGPNSEARYTARTPFISSFRRNLQREYIANLIEIALEGESGGLFGPRYPRAARTLAWDELRLLSTRIQGAQGHVQHVQLDRYSESHLAESHARITKALDAAFTVGGNEGDSGF